MRMKIKIKWSKMCWLVLLVALVSGTGGCGTFVAHRMTQAPNTYPTWFAPKARVELGFSPKLMSHFPVHYVDVGPPVARLCYRVVDPADYHLKVATTNWVENGEPNFDFSFAATVPAATNSWTMKPRGTVVLLHGYGVAQFSMVPWALRLAEEGWRCVLVDLRGHGKSTGRQIYFGVQETYDLSQLLDKLGRDGQLAGPVSAFGESYGAALALRWESVDPRVRSAVAIAPYAELSNAVLNIYQDYAGWLPKRLVKAGLRELPSVLKLEARDLDTTTVLQDKKVAALFVAGAEDKVMPLGDVERLSALAAPGSEIVVVPKATHEAVTYFFDVIVPPVLAWLDHGGGVKTQLGAR
ncbi:MAG: alpha/beta hydrolase [Pedosphaera sp.]|nr:alpha/beta hydrolase [Pedosphaera sp.]